jgi:PilZ domain
MTIGLFRTRHPGSGQQIYTLANEMSPMMTQERRRAPRYALIASAQLIEPQTNTLLRARTSDLSLVGCYLDMKTSLPVGTEVRLHVVHDEVTFTALGVVAHGQPNMGMGIRFTDVPLEQHEILEKWLAALVRD